jgi:hypothetical protein
MINAISNNNLLISTMAQTNITIDYMSFFDTTDLDDYDMIKSLYDGLLSRFILDQTNQTLIPDPTYTGISTFADMLSKQAGLSIIIYGYDQISITQITDGTLTIDKTIFKCLIIGQNQITNSTTYYYMVNIMEDYFGYVKYNNVNVYTMNFV